MISSQVWTHRGREGHQALFVSVGPRARKCPICKVAISHVDRPEIRGALRASIEAAAAAERSRERSPRSATDDSFTAQDHLCLIQLRVNKPGHNCWATT